ncbi:hypothetical protein GX48_06637 [Paracoccidioides brasiliensis]|nr:hypothetical protein GX48_06637 [Paracoccidioides brasiliensis]
MAEACRRFVSQASRIIVPLQSNGLARAWNEWKRKSDETLASTSYQNSVKKQLSQFSKFDRVVSREPRVPDNG